MWKEYEWIHNKFNNEEIRKGNDYVTKFQGQPLCKETGCAVIKEGRCKSTKICRKNTKDFPGYYCIDDYCNYDDCVYMYIEELSTDIRDADQKEGRRMITEECSIKMTESTWYPCHDTLCKGKDCFCSSQEQILSEDIGCDDRKEGECRMKKNCA